MPAIRETATNCGRGGIGQSLRFGKSLASIPDDSRVKVPELRMKVDDFCRRYCLGDETSGRLREAGFDRAHDLLEVTDTALSEAGFLLGHIAELSCTMKNTLHGKPATSCLERVTSTVFVGGIGGSGGAANKVGGGGGLGEAPGIVEQDAKYFQDIRGGTGGMGGACGKIDGRMGTSEVEIQKTHGENDTLLKTNLPRLFGGTGGAGGRSVIEGGLGGMGQGPKFPTPFISFNEAAWGVEPTLLAVLDVSDCVLKLLGDQGFVTVGGLCEVTEDDLEKIGLQVGQISGLKRAVRDFFIMKAGRGTIAAVSGNTAAAGHTAAVSRIYCRVH
ncbi:hypothetical protein DFH07DRAFT_946909 [Mycena maculata]|uniref:Uncharacterized protein n=1 Tax=Mycena maculata TaxID=230809 RepID=A0AAD7HI32_9AGAR|nr:hypothetical protein DFH07DRAFT_946909 [Mycena maculata]